MTRLGRVEVYRTTRTRTRWVQCSPDCDHPAPSGRGVGWHTRPGITPGWSWRYFAANGVQIARCSESHGRLRNVARSLELAFPGYRLLDQDCGLNGPAWFLHGMEFAYPHCAAEHAIPEDMVMGMGMRGVRIPVATPVNLTSRVRR